MAITPAEEQALGEMRASLIDGPRPVLEPGQGHEAFLEHVLLSIRVHRAALLNKHKEDGDGVAWTRYFESYFASSQAKANAKLLWDDWRTKLVKEDTPGPGIAITHGQPDVHWKTDPQHRLWLNLESMWADFEASLDRFVESLRSNPRRCRVILKRWRARTWVIVQFAPNELRPGAATASALTSMIVMPKGGARSATAHGPD